MMAPDTVADLVARLPGPDSRSVKGAEGKAAMERTLAAILEGGQERVAALADLLAAPGAGDDSKARYALGALAVLVCRPPHRKHRPVLAEALASALAKDRSAEVKAFIVRQLQTAGGKEATAALGRLLTDRDLCEPAAQALLAIRQGAAEQFRAALGKAEGGRRLTIVQALGVLRDGQSAGALRGLVSDEDRDTRLAAAWALASMGDASSVDALLKAADSKTPYERIKGAQACLLLAERLGETGRDKEARKVYRHLRETRTGDAERYVREAAERGLAAREEK
jgi:HEAT repeat protein